MAAINKERRQLGFGGELLALLFGLALAMVLILVVVEQALVYLLQRLNKRLNEGAR